MKKIIIIGCGSGGRILSQLIRQQGGFQILGFLDDNRKLQGKKVNGYKVIGTCGDLNNFKGLGVIISIGTNMYFRSVIFKVAVTAKLKPVTFIHRSAFIDSSAKIGEGSVILANCVINPFTKIGENAFIFSRTVIEHDNIIGKNVYFSPAVSLAGGVRVGDNAFFGINSCVIEGIKIGNNVIIGAGSVVLKDIPSNTVVAGVPAKILRRND